jgi:hypothetical protein
LAREKMEHFLKHAFQGARGIILKMAFTEPVNAGGIRAEYRQIWRQE